MSLTLSVAVLVSLAWSLTLIPLLASAVARRSSHHAPPPDLDHATRLDRGYVSSLRRWLHRPLLGAVSLVLLTAFAAVMYFQVGSGFLPAADEGGFVIDYLTPAGSALEGTDARLRKIEAILHDTPDIATYSRRTGS